MTQGKERAEEIEVVDDRRSIIIIIMRENGGGGCYFGLGMWLKWFTGFPDIDSEFDSLGLFCSLFSLSHQINFSVCVVCV